MSSDEKRPLGKILLQRKLVSQQELDAALRAQRRSSTPAPLLSQLIDDGKVNELDALRALSEQYGVPGLDLTQIAIVLDHLDVVPRELAEAHRILPVLMRGDRIFLAMADPNEKRVVDELEFVTGKKVYPYVAIHSTLLKTIAAAYDARARSEAHFLGPRVPEETLRQLGLTATTASEAGAAAGAGVTPPVSLKPPQKPPLPPAAQAPPLPTAALQGSSARVPPPPPPLRRPPPSPARAADPATPSVPVMAESASRAADKAGEGGPAGASPVSRAPPQAGSTSRSASFDPAVIKAPAVDSASFTSEVSTSDFGNIGEEVSSVTHLPDEFQVRASQAADAIGTGTGKLILVVDDEEDIRKLLRRLLTQKGHRVLEADRGLLALRLVKDHMPDLIILDAMLPELHGFDIAHRIKGSAKYGHIPIIMVSAVYRGWRIAEDLRQNYGIEEYLEKPFRILDLLSTVQRLLTTGDRDSAAPGRGPEYLSSDAESSLASGIAAYKGGQIDEAIEHLQRGVAIDPLAYRLHFHLALLYGKKGQVYEGIQELERAIDLNPKHFPALKNLAVLYERAGFKNKAIEMWERSAALAPDDATRTFIKDHLRKLI